MGEQTRACDGALDVVGVGFGPSNIALAIALAEYNRSVAVQQRLSYAFVERQPAFGWHRGMLIDGATMQVSFLKDLVTLRNPTSEFSFISYLHNRNRLVDFINHQCLFPSRLEFHDYLAWAATKFDDNVTYDSEVVDMSPVAEQGDVVALDIRTAGPSRSPTDVVLRARNVVLATGLTPSMPPRTASDRVWHSDHLLDRITEEPARSSTRFLIVGAGQSAAEVAEYLHRVRTTADVHVVYSRYGMSPADDSPFVNGIFDPTTVRTFFDAPTEVKEMLLRYHNNTNYSVVDADLIGELYRRSYQERVLGRRRLHLENMSRVVEVVATPEHVRSVIEFLPTGRKSTLETDVVVYATGYQPTDLRAVLGQASGICKWDSENRLRVGVDYRAATTDGVTCGVYVQGSTEHSHGLSSSLLSNSAVRAGQIVDAIAASRQRGLA